MDLKRLQYFRQLAQTGNFTKAADQLGIAQSALSTSIKKLEHQLGLKLVNRTERQMSLTAEGQVLLRHANIILEDVLACFSFVHFYLTPGHQVAVSGSHHDQTWI